MPPQYKFVEVSPVTDEALEAAVNEWVGKGWQLEDIRFVLTEHSKRPQLAFVVFLRSMPAMSSDRPGPATANGSAGPPEQAARVITAPHGDEVE